MEPKILGVGPRTAAYLRIAYPKSRAKLIARDFRVSTGTAERWLKGEAPTVAHIEQMTAVFGEPYIRALFVEAFERHDERIKELEALSLSAIVASGVGGVAAGVSYIRNLADQGVTALKELADWAGKLVRLSPASQLFEISPDPGRILLITGLIETVPDRLPPPTSQKESYPNDQVKEGAGS